MKSVSVIIPFYNHWEMTHQRLVELYRFVPEPLEIVLVNDCSTERRCGWWHKVVAE